MRIIAGSLKGRKLKGFKGDSIRPTSDRARETLFNVIGASISGSSFLDLFAGTGAVGIEAISRGAQEALLVDSSPVAAGVIMANLDMCGIDIKTRPSKKHSERISSAFTTGSFNESELLFLRKDAISAIGKLKKQSRRFDFVFFDPPYQEGLYLPVLRLIREHSLLRPGGCIIAEHMSKDILEFPELRFMPAKKVRVGDTSFSWFDLESDG